MNRNWLSGCRDDKALKIFLDDLGRARAAFVDNDNLQIPLAGSEGIMYFGQESFCLRYLPAQARNFTT